MCISSPETNSWSVIYRKNSGEDINITSLTFKNSLLAARTLMVPENYMICILRNGERVRRWDREILAGSKMDKACELAESLSIPNLVLWHTEDKNLSHRKELYTAEGKEYYHGNLLVPDDGEIIKL